MFVIHVGPAIVYLSRKESADGFHPEGLVRSGTRVWRKTGRPRCQARLVSFVRYKKMRLERSLQRLDPALALHG